MSPRSRDVASNGWQLRIAALVAVLAMTGLSGLAVAAGDSSESAQASRSATTLHPGDRGAAVKLLQRKLGLRADGVYGSATKRAVRRFQVRRGLKADGVAGRSTLAALGIVRAAGGNGGATYQRSEEPAPSKVRVPAALRKIAKCESGGNPRAVSRDGRYRGKYQFDLSTWRAMGGSGDPAKASEAEQDRRAVALYRKRGTAPWANCA